MKVFFFFFLCAALLSAGLTFVIFPEKPDELTEIRARYPDVFPIFGQNAEELYREHGKMALDMLKQYHIEGLRLLHQYDEPLRHLSPFIEQDILIALCQQQGDRLQHLLTIYQPAMLGELYARVGEDGFRMLLERPDALFLFQRYGVRLVGLVADKGMIVLDMVQHYQPEFIELYYDDTLFTALAQFGADGLLAITTYRGMAATMLELFADDSRFHDVLTYYGYRQVIPILHYFYTLPDVPDTRLQQFLNADWQALFQPADESAGAEAQQDRLTTAHRQADQARWALQRMDEAGHTFLRQFRIADDGTVTPLTSMSLTNILEDAFLAPVITPLSGSEAESSENCEGLLTALHLLSLLPQESFLAKQATCRSLRIGLPSATERKGIQGLLRLEKQAELVERYGEQVIPFVAQFGTEGLSLIEETAGRVLNLRTIYGNELIYSALKYGPAVLEITQTFGERMLMAIQRTDGEILPYVQEHGEAVLSLLEQPDGEALFTLIPVYGEELVALAIRFPEDFRCALLKYGHWALKAFRDHGTEAIPLVREYGDEVVYDIGRYGEAGLHLAQQGTTGILLLRVMPNALWEEHASQLAESGLPGILFILARYAPQRFHQYIGLLGQMVLHLPPIYAQLIFWTLICLFLLFLGRGLVLLVRGIF